MPLYLSTNSISPSTFSRRRTTRTKLFEPETLAPQPPTSSATDDTSLGRPPLSRQPPSPAFNFSVTISRPISSYSYPISILIWM